MTIFKFLREQLIRGNKSKTTKDSRVNVCIKIAIKDKAADIFMSRPSKIPEKCCFRKLQGKYL